MPRRAWRYVLLVAVSAVGVMALSGSAQALTNFWHCNRSAGSHCTDPDTYRSWTETFANSASAADDSQLLVVHSLCTKAATAAGNIRSTVGGTYCNGTTYAVQRCLISATPMSNSYSYWVGGSGLVHLDSFARSPSSSPC